MPSSASFGYGYREHPPLDPCPMQIINRDVHQRIETDQIVILRLDSGAVQANERAQEQMFEPPPIVSLPEFRLELLECPQCGNTDNLVLDGRWGDLPTVTCPRCQTATEATEPSEEPLGPFLEEKLNITAQDRERIWLDRLAAFPEYDWARNLFMRLLLITHDPSYAARRLHYRLLWHRARFREGRGTPQDEPAVRLLGAVDATTADLGRTMTEALHVALPKPYRAHDFSLLLAQIALALCDPQISSSGGGELLDEDVRKLIRTLPAHG